MWNKRLNTEQTIGKQNANLTDEETSTITSPPLQKTWHFLLGPTMGPKWKLNWRLSAIKQQVTQPIQTPPAHQSWLDGVRTTPTKTGSYKSQQDTDQTVRRQKRIRNGVATPYDIKARWCGLFYWSWPALNRIHPITVQTYTVSLSSVSASRQMVTVIYPLPERE